jgi:hypothetical protein
MPQETPPADEQIAQEEILIGRIVDHEATPQELERFAHMADDRLPLWRTLARQQISMGLLAEGVLDETAAAEAVEVAQPTRREWSIVALSGWAAVLVLGVWWAVVAPKHDTPRRPPQLDRVVGTAPQSPTRPDDHLREYLAAPFVIGVHDPIVLETEPLESGRHRVYFMRRIEEYVDIDTPPDAVIDQKGQFKIAPAELRK